MSWPPLILLVALAWVAVLGALRRKVPLDRLHAASLLNAAGPILLALAALAADGFTDRVGKLVLLAAIVLVGGAVSSHVIARALRIRGSDWAD